MYGRRRKLTEEQKQVNKAKRETRNAQAMTCQVCGRAILAHTGMIAHHGYTRPWEGMQTSSCEGARHVPFEVSRDALGLHIDNVRAHLKSRRSHVQKIRDEQVGVSFKYRAKIKNDPYHRTEDVYLNNVTRANWAQLEIENPEAFRQRRQSMYGRGEFNFDFVKANAIDAVEKEIAGWEGYIKMQSSRFNSWKFVTHEYNASTKSWDKK